MIIEVGIIVIIIYLFINALLLGNIFSSIDKV